MKILYSRSHLFHVPVYEIFNGHADPHAEVPPRVENIKNILVANGYKINSPTKKTPFSLLTKTHQRDYVNFLKNWSLISYPSVFPYNGISKDRKLMNPLANLGKYSFDLYTPISKYIFKIASSANKIEVAKTVGKNYNVKVVSVNIVNIPRKARRVGKTKGFKSGYKKAIVTLATGQSIEIK